jgi:hypothetical protein
VSLRRWRDRAALARDLAAFRLRHPWLPRVGAGAAGGGRRVLVVSLTNWVCQLKQESMLAKALQLRGYAPVIAVPRRARLARAYFRAFGFTELLCLDDFVDGVDAAAAAREAAALFRSLDGLRSAFALEHRGVQLGRHLLSTLLRRSLDGRLDLAAPARREALRAGLADAVRLVGGAEALLDRARPDLVLFNEKNYLPYGAVFDVALRRGLAPIQFVSAQQPGAFVFKRYTPDTRNLHPFSLSPPTWQRVKAMEWSEAMGRAIVDQIRDGYAKGTWFKQKYHFATRPSAPAGDPRAVLGLDPARPTAVVFSHVLWDATFFYGESLFDDYQEWLVETVRAACANPALNWVVKLHPDYVFKMKMAGVTGDVPDVKAMNAAFGELPPHVKILLPSGSVSTGDLTAVADYALTVRGTAGIEMPCFGIPVITAGTGRYHGLGFTVDSGTRAEYLERLARLQHQPRMTPGEVELARRHAYALFRLRPCPFSTFETVYAPFDRLGYPLDHNVVIHARSAREMEDAADLRAFAEWAASDAPDFLRPC